MGWPWEILSMILLSLQLYYGSVAHSILAGRFTSFYTFQIVLVGFVCLLVKLVPHLLPRSSQECLRSGFPFKSVYCNIDDYINFMSDLNRNPVSVDPVARS